MPNSWTITVIRQASVAILSMIASLRSDSAEVGKRRTRGFTAHGEATDRALRAFLASRGLKKGLLPRFVEEAVRERLFDLTVAEVKEGNAGQADAVMQAVAEALKRG